MLTSQRVMMIHKKIVEYHGRIDAVKVFDTDPTPFIEEAAEKEKARLKAELEAKREAERLREAGEEPEESKEPPAAAVKEEEEDQAPKYTLYADPSMTIYEIFKSYGHPTRNEVDEDP